MEAQPTLCIGLFNQHQQRLIGDIDTQSLCPTCAARPSPLQLQVRAAARLSIEPLLGELSRCSACLADDRRRDDAYARKLFGRYIHVPWPWAGWPGYETSTEYEHSIRNQAGRIPCESGNNY